jgi:hypothetical protein
VTDNYRWQLGRVMVASPGVGKWKKRGEDQPRPAAGIVEVSVDDYLTNRQPVPHLFDVTRQMDPAAFEAEATKPDIATIAGIVRTRGERHTDVRLLVEDGERFVGLAAELAELLRCDVFLTRHGARIRFVRESSNVAGKTWDAISVDQATGDPVDWLVVRPADLPDDAPMWFVTASGRLRQGSGLVTVSLPDGMAFATKATFRDTAALAARMNSNVGRVTAIAVNAEMGRFEINRFDDGGTLLTGVEFATLIAASLDVVHPDVQLALTWPRNGEACAALDVELMRLADGLNRTVWVPEPAGAAFVVPGCGDFAAVDEVGSPSMWRPYVSRMAPERALRYRTDDDGRLVPDGRVVGARFPGVPFVSVPSAQLDHLREWYASVAPNDALFAMDLAVLADGRLGVMLDGNRAVAVGPRELRQLLREAGWAGQDLLLLAQPSAASWSTTTDHARHLGDLLKVDVWLPVTGAEVWAEPDGTLASDGPDGAEAAWHVIPYGRPADLDGEGQGIPVPPALVGGARTAPRPPAGPPEPERPAVARNDAALTETAVFEAAVFEAAIFETSVFDPAAAGVATSGSVVELVQPIRSIVEASALESEPLLADGEPPASMAFAPPVIAPRMTIPDPVVAAGPVVSGTVVSGTVVEEPAVEPVAVVLAPAAGGDLSHAVPWLPTSPVVNHRPLDLYLWSTLAAGEIEGWGLPSADLFLLAGQDPLRLADRNPGGILLRVSAPAKTAVDLVEHARHAPAPVQQRLLATGATHLLPLAWLPELSVTGRFDLDGAGGVSARRDVESAALAVRFEGAEHGVPGLPNEVVHWPDKRLRADAPSYLVLPESPTAATSVVDRGFIALSRKKPAVEDGQRLLEVKIRRRRAIDVPATLDMLAGLPVVGRLHDFVGLDVLLSQADLAKAVVTKVWRHENGKAHVDKLSGATLEDVLADPAYAGAV